MYIAANYREDVLAYIYIRLYTYKRSFNRMRYLCFISSVIMEALYSIWKLREH